MNKYMIVKEKANGNLEVVTNAETREAAFVDLKDKAEVGVVYYEVKILGEPITVKTRETVVLSRVSNNPTVTKEVAPEVPVEEPKKETADNEED